MSQTASTIVHSTALVDPKAKLGEGVHIGPYCIVGAEVEIGDRSELMANIFLEGPMRMGADNKFYPYSSLGVAPQDLKYRGERSETIIGSKNTFREFITVHRGTEGGGSVTRIGDRNLLMAYAHIAHDCNVGNDTILANATTLAGHVTIEDFAVIGAFTGVHQFCRIGRHCLIGGYSTVTKDVLPFSKTVEARTIKAYGINSVGLQRRGFSPERRNKIQRAFRILRTAKMNTTQALDEIRKDAAGSEDLQHFIRFIETSERGVVK